MKTIIKIFLPFYLLGFSQAHAETYVSGEVWGTWTSEGNPYLVLGDTLVIPSDSILTLEAGVNIKFTENDAWFLVHGGLISRGTASDSVTIEGEEDIIWMTIKSSDIPNHNDYIDLEYTNIYDANGGIYAAFASISVRLSNCKLAGSIGSFATPLEIVDSEIGFDDPDDSSIHAIGVNGNIINSILSGEVTIDGGGFITLESCSIIGYGAGLFLYSIDAHVEKCLAGYMVLGYQGGISSSVTIIDNTFGGIIANRVEESLFQNNTITNWVEFNDTEDVEFIGNRIGSYVYAQDDWRLTFERNTVLGIGEYYPHVEKTITVYNPNDVIISNNIIEGIVGVWLWFGNPDELEIDYNNIFVSDLPVWNCDLGTGNVCGDPFVIGGEEPINYNLQCGSAAVDAADPDLPLDPDQTPADIGADFFDWRYNHPPNSFASDDSLTLWIGDTLNCYVWMFDDAPLTTWTFDMPPWLAISSGSDNWQTDTVFVCGVIPSGQLSFTIQAIAEDADGLTDTAEVYVFVYPENYLHGSLSGVLDVSFSPYLVFEDIFLAEGDTLVIMPGVELQFMNTGFQVDGKLICEGTEEDSIVFTTALMEPEPELWDRITIFHDIQDTICLSYCRIEYGNSYTVNIDSGAVKISNCSFYNNHYLIIFFDYSNVNYGVVEDNYFDSSNDAWSVLVLRQGICRYNHIDGTGKICLFNPGAIAEHNLIENCEQGISASGNSIVRYNEIYNSEVSGLSSVFSEGPLFYGNFVSGCEYGGLHDSFFEPDVHPYYFNNVFENCRVGFYVEGGASQPDTSYIYNNVFRNCEAAFENTENQYVFTVFENNSISDCDTAFHQQDNRIDQAYNNIFNCAINYAGFPPGTGEIVTVNNNGDPCDANFNIYLDPLYGGGDPFDYHLLWASPLKNAGNPDPQFNDPDSTINDIGLYGGPYGESYPYLEAANMFQEEIPADFHLSQNYPNPFNSGTIFYYSLPRPSDVDVTITNVLGQTVKSWHFDHVQPGYHRVQWDGTSASGRRVSNGIYVCHVRTDYTEASQVMMMLK